MASTTIDTETELSAVNAILGAIGQSPVTSLGNTSSTTTTSGGTTVTTNSYENPEVAFVYNLLRDSNIDVQNEGWHFNTEKHVEYKPNSNNKIEVGNDVLKMDVTDGWTLKHYDVVKRNGFLYDKYDHTDDWSDVTEIYLDITRLISYEDIPEVFKRYIIYKASTRAATQLVGNPQLARLLAQQEGLARANCLEYDCTQGNHSMFNFPEDSSFSTFQPWRTLRR